MHGWCMSGPAHQSHAQLLVAVGDGLNMYGATWRFDTNSAPHPALAAARALLSSRTAGSCECRTAPGWSPFTDMWALDLGWVALGALWPPYKGPMRKEYERKMWACARENIAIRPCGLGESSAR